jgi:hypothetical protein
MGADVTHRSAESSRAWPKSGGLIWLPDWVLRDRQDSADRVRLPSGLQVLVEHNDVRADPANQP